MCPIPTEAMQEIHAVNKQTETGIKEDKEYQIALDKGDLYKVNRKGNMYRSDAKEAIYMKVYV